METNPEYLIAQCYFRKDQESKLFKDPLYRGFGLEPEVNPNLFQNCPELEDPSVRLALTEYACLLWYYRNQDQLPKEGFGTTSYRQLDKVDYISTVKDVEVYHDSHISTWGLSEFYDADGNPLPCSLQAEIAHPGINSYIKATVKNVPDQWYTSNRCILANYWLTNIDSFLNFMEWSWPLVKNALYDFKNKTHHYFTNKMNFGADPNKAVGYYMERLFSIWSMEGYSINEVVPAKKLYSPVRIYV